MSGLLDTATTVGATLVVEGRVPGLDANGLRSVVTDLRGRVADRQAVIALFSPSGDGPDAKVPFVIATTAAARDAGIKAGDLVKVAAGVLGGGGGGKPDLAQGGGQDASKLGAAIAEVEHTVGRTVTN